MRYSFVFFMFLQSVVFGQKPVCGVYKNDLINKTRVVLYPDSSFLYCSNYDPVSYKFETFSQKGRWTISADTILLNPGLTEREIITSDFTEKEITGDTCLVLSFNHILRYIDSAGIIYKTDTVNIMQLDFAFNELKKKNRTRVTRHLNTCTFAGYIPKAIITDRRTVSIRRPAGTLNSIYIGCYELQGMKAFPIVNPHDNHYTFNVYTNYYQDGKLRNYKLLLIKNKLYINRKENGRFSREVFLVKRGG